MRIWPAITQTPLQRLTPFAESGNARAQAHLGHMYESGWGVARDHGEALRWYMKAAEQGEAFSQAHAGYLYEQGLGVARNEQRAAELYEKAGVQGFAWAQMKLGLFFVNGRALRVTSPRELSCFGRPPRLTMSGRSIISAGPMRAVPAFPRQGASDRLVQEGRSTGEPQARARLHGLGVGESFWGTLLRHVGLNGW